MVSDGIHTDTVLGPSRARRLGRTARPFAGLPMAQAALRFARARHAGQHREIDHSAFIAHPIEVGLLLRRDGQPDDVIAAGLLHDVLEKTATTSAELHRRFGARILRLVESVSDDPSIGEYTSRKHELRDRVARGDSNPRAIFAADKISKVRELALLPARRLGETTVRAGQELPAGCHRSGGRGLQLGRDQSRAGRGPGSGTRRRTLRCSAVRVADEPIAVA